MAIPNLNEGTISSNPLDVAKQALQQNEPVEPKALVLAITDSEFLSDLIKEFSQLDERLLHMEREDPDYQPLHDHYNDLLNRIIDSRATTFGGLAWKAADLLTMLEMTDPKGPHTMCRSILLDVVNLWALGLISDKEQPQPRS